MSEPSALAVAERLSPVEGSFVDWTEWMPIVPSKKAVARRSGLRGHQSTWKAQLSREGSYTNG